MAFKFDSIFGDAESMTKEQIEQALQQQGIKLADLSTGEYVSADKYNRVSGELNSIKQANMTEAEKQQQQIEAIMAQNKSLIKDRTKSKIEAVFSKAGIDSGNYQNLIDRFSDLDEADAMASVQGIVENITKNRTDIETRIRQELMQGMSSPSGGSADGVNAKKFSEMTMAERMKLKSEQPELYKSEYAKLKSKT